MGVSDRAKHCGIPGSREDARPGMTRSGVSAAPGHFTLARKYANSTIWASEIDCMTSAMVAS